MEGNKSAVQVAHELWRCFGERRWDDARKLLADDFEADWPQSREKIVGPDNFIGLNRDYPGVHEIRSIAHQHSYDCWDHADHVTTQVSIKSHMPDGKKLDLFAISFFEIRDDLIFSAVEYWADTYPAPEWRRKYVERY